jgi:PadR family transcriptional regulator, regulatory protein PadR
MNTNLKMIRVLRVDSRLIFLAYPTHQLTALVFGRLFSHDTLTVYNRIVDNHSMGKPSDLVQGTLDLLILKTLSLEPKHGWAIAKRIQQISNEVLQVQQGSLYPALHRLEQQGWIRAKWDESETGRQAKFYSLTAAGRAQLEKEKKSWKRLSTAIDVVIDSL